MSDANGNFIGTSASPIDPLLGPLANNGGPTQTHKLLAGSPAIQAGDPSFVGPTTDQRGAGFERVLFGRIDMGAIEFRGPIVTNPIPDQMATERVLFDFPFAIDTFGDADGDPLAYSATLPNGGALPSWLMFDAASRRFFGTPGTTDVGPAVAVRVIANDGNSTVFDDFLLTVVNPSPMVANPIPNQTATERILFDFSFAANTFSDDNLDPLVYSATLSTGGALPSWLTFNPTTRRFSGTPGTANVGSFTVRVTADDGNTTVSDEFLLTVIDPAPMVANPIPNQTATERILFDFSFAANTFSDDNLDPLVYSATLSTGGALPSWLTFNPTTRRFSGTPGTANVGSFTVRVTADDGNTTVSDEFLLTVINPRRWLPTRSPIRRRPSESCSTSYSRWARSATRTWIPLSIRPRWSAAAAHCPHGLRSTPRRGDSPEHPALLMSAHLPSASRPTTATTRSSTTSSSA